MTAAPLAGNGRPLLLTGPNGLPPETSTWLTTNAASLDNIIVIGGGGGNTPKGLVAISSGNNHGCQILDGSVSCWGGNDDGRLGNGTNTNSPSPVMVHSVGGGFTNSEVIVVTAGHVFTCAVQGESAYCWGTNWQGFLGNGTTNDSTVPVLVGGVGDA